MRHLEQQIKDFGQQFSDQVKCLESKVGVDSSILSNVLELYKRRAAIEQDYADSLSKLSSSITQRNNIENIKRPKWKNYSPVKVLNSLLASTEHTARAHKNLSDIYGKQMTQRIIDMQEDCLRLTRRSTEILQRRQTEILLSLNQLLQKQKNYIKLFNEASDCKRKMDKTIDQLDREVVRCQTKRRDFEKNFKIKKLKEEYIEKYDLYKDKQTESTAARNRYIIHLVSLNDAIEHFYTNELNTITQCSQYGFHNNLTRLSMNQGSCEEALYFVHESISKLFSTTIDHIDATNDSSVFYGVHKSIFTLKEQLHFSPARDDNICTIVRSEQKVQNDLQTMLVKFDSEMQNVLKSLDDKKHNIEMTSKAFNDLINQTDYDVVEYVCNETNYDLTLKERSLSISRVSLIDQLYLSIQRRIRDQKLKVEISYFKLMEEYLNDQINKVNITTKQKNVENALSSEIDEMNALSSKKHSIQSQTAIMIGMKTKLFGGDLKKYSFESKENVPLVVRSCIRLINLYGMRNIGVFRVPGSQYDVQMFKTQFECGEDPISALSGSVNDVNSAASLLKLYFRELDPPVFDEIMFNEMVDMYSEAKQNEPIIVQFLKEIVVTLHPALYTTVAYLVAFVSHLSEFSAENCMDIINLAIIFGPCLMHIPESKNNQLFHYQAIINHISLCLITYRHEIFVRQSDGPFYQRDQRSSDRNEDSNIEPHSALQLAKPSFFEDSFQDRAVKDCSIFKSNDSAKCPGSKPSELRLFGRRSSDSEKNRNPTGVTLANYNAKLDQNVTMESDTFSISSSKSNADIFTGSSISNGKNAQMQFSNDHSPNEYLTSLPSNIFTGSYTPSSNIEYLKGNDQERDSPRDTNLSLSVLNTPDLSDVGESRCLESYDPIIMENLTEKERCDMIDIDRVKIRSGSMLRSVDVGESIDIVDDDLRQTMQGLQKIEQLNVAKHRSTILIDKSLLNSKFISPLWPDLTKSTINDTQINEEPLAVISNALDLVTKLPDNLSSLLSSIDATDSNKAPKTTLHNSSGSLSAQSTLMFDDYSVSVHYPAYSKSKQF